MKLLVKASVSDVFRPFLFRRTWKMLGVYAVMDEALQSVLCSSSASFL